MTQKLEVQKFLSTRTFGELAKEWGVYARCDKLGYKFSLNYDQLEYTPGFYPSAQCRGLILALKRNKDNFIPNVAGKISDDFCPGDTTVLAYPFDKFYNEHERHAAKLCWDERTIVQDKMDGTMCLLYWDHVKQDWCVSTRSVPDADLPLDGKPDWSFRKLFEHGVQETFGMPMSKWTEGLPKGVCWMFELTSPYNRIFVNYKETRVTLLGARDMRTLHECNPEILLISLNRTMPRPTTWPLNSVADIQRFVNNRSPEECEGAVVVDAFYQRVKIKNVHWVTANAIKSSLGTSPRNLMRYVLSGMSDDIMSMLPEDMQQNLYRMQEAIQALFRQTDQNFADWKAEAGTNRKHFAEIVSLRAKWPAPYFKLYEGKFATTGEFIRDMVVREKLGESMIDDLLKLVSHT